MILRAGGSRLARPEPTHSGPSFTQRCAFSIQMGPGLPNPGLPPISRLFSGRTGSLPRRRDLKGAHPEARAAQAARCPAVR